MRECARGWEEPALRTTVANGHDVPSFFSHVDGILAEGLKPTLAMVFGSPALDLDAVRNGLSRLGMAVVGASTAGEVANATVLRESCAALLMEADPAAFEVRLIHADGGSMFAVGRELGRFAAGRFANPVVITFASGVKTDGEPVVLGIQDGAGGPIPLFGGMAGDDLAMHRTLVFSGDGTSEQGAVGLVLDGRRIRAEGIVPNGWQSVGIAKTITRAEANIVYTIDDRPAVEVYRKYMEIDENNLQVPGIQYPLRIERPNGMSVLRPPLFCQPDQSMIFAGSVPQGAKVTFCIPPSIDIVERVLGEAAELHRRMPQADALIVVDCAARYLALGPLADDEIRGLYDLWNAPMAGFFSYGEIGGREPALCDFHTQTCTLIVLREATV
jgi:hypothetical protein